MATTLPGTALLTWSYRPEFSLQARRREGAAACDDEGEFHALLGQGDEAAERRRAVHAIADPVAHIVQAEIGKVGRVVAQTCVASVGVGDVHADAERVEEPGRLDRVLGQAVLTGVCRHCCGS